MRAFEDRCDVAETTVPVMAAKNNDRIIARGGGGSDGGLGGQGNDLANVYIGIRVVL